MSDHASPWDLAAALCDPSYPTVDGVFRALRLGRPMQADRSASGSLHWSQKGPYLLAGNRCVKATAEPATVPGWMVALVLASLVHRSPPVELLAAAATLLAERKVEVVQ